MPVPEAKRTKGIKGDKRCTYGAASIRMKTQKGRPQNHVAPGSSRKDAKGDKPRIHDKLKFIWQGKP